jgi:hypothetical protein
MIMMQTRIGLCAFLLILVTAPLRRNPLELSQAQIAGGHLRERLVIASSNGVQLYDPSTQTFKRVPNMLDNHPVLLASGKFLLTAGDSFCLFDLTSTACGQMFQHMIPFSTYSSLKTLLEDGRVLVIGAPAPDATAARAFKMQARTTCHTARPSEVRESPAKAFLLTPSK